MVWGRGLWSSSAEADRGLDARFCDGVGHRKGLRAGGAESINLPKSQGPRFASAIAFSRVSWRGRLYRWSRSAMMDAGWATRKFGGRFAIVALTVASANVITPACTEDSCERLGSTW